MTHLAKTHLFLVPWNTFPVGFPKKDSQKWRKPITGTLSPETSRDLLYPTGMARTGCTESFIGKTWVGLRRAAVTSRLECTVLQSAVSRSDTEHPRFQDELHPTSPQAFSHVFLH